MGNPLKARHFLMLVSRRVTALFGVIPASVRSRAIRRRVQRTANPLKRIWQTLNTQLGTSSQCWQRADRCRTLRVGAVPAGLAYWRVMRSLTCRSARQKEG